MKIFSNIVRAAALAAVALGASALAPTTGSEAQAQSGYWHGGHRVSHQRVVHRPVYRHRHVAPRRVYHRPVVRHYGPRYRPIARYHYGPRIRPIYVAPTRCVIRARWVNTYYGPQLVRKRVCHRAW